MKAEKANSRAGWIWIAAAAVLALALPALAGWLFDGRPSTWEGTAEELKADEFTFPVLKLELGGPWTDFELKASTNNFASMVYYYVSSLTNNATCSEGHLLDDPDPYTYYTDDHATDVRRWIPAPAHTSIWSRLLSSNTVVECVYFYPSHAGGCPWARWMSRTNAQLVWSYVRFDGVSFELNASGTRQHWNPVRPEEWVKARTVP